MIMRVLATAAVLSLLTVCAAAQQRPARPVRVFMARPNILSGNIGIGTVAREFAAGFSLEYERFLDKDGKLSISLPFTAYTNGSKGNMFMYDHVSAGTRGYFIAPGIRFHPKGNTQRADFGLGGGIALGLHHLRETYQKDGLSPLVERHFEQALCAVLAQANLNLHFSRGFMLGFHASAGPMLTQGATRGALVQFGFKAARGW